MSVSVCSRLFCINPKMYLFHHFNWAIRIQYRFRPNSFLCSSSMSVRAGAVSSASPKLSQTSKIIHQWSHISVINNSDNKYAANAFDTRSDYDHFNCQKFPWINFFSSLGLNQILPWLPYKLHLHCKKVHHLFMEMGLNPSPFLTLLKKFMLHVQSGTAYA